MREKKSLPIALWEAVTLAPSSVTDVFQSTPGNLLTDIYHPKPRHPGHKRNFCA